MYIKNFNNICQVKKLSQTQKNGAIYNYFFDKSIDN